MSMHLHMFHLGKTKNNELAPKLFFWLQTFSGFGARMANTSESPISKTASHAPINVYIDTVQDNSRAEWTVGI